MNKTRLMSRAQSLIEQGSVLKSQLEREIFCLERQLDRLKIFDNCQDNPTCRTYEDMIFSRRELLSGLR